MLKYLFSIILSLIGFIYFLFFKKTPNIFYQSYVRAYCFTNGSICLFFSKIISLIDVKKKPNNLIKSDYFLNSLNYKKIQTRLKSDGYYIFDQKLNDTFLKNIHEFTSENECHFFDDNGNRKIGKYNKGIKHLSSKFSYDESKIFNMKEINKLIFDPDIIKICENYFNSSAHLSNIDMWWTPVRSNINLKTEIANKSAQFFHFDLDRVKWLKFFIYLTDTTVDDGPHEYVVGTNRVSKKDKFLLNRGYKRINEKDIYSIYESEKIQKILGKKGTIFVGDTSCFHRGYPPIKNDRLLLVLEYSNSLFGGNFTKINTNKKNNLQSSLKIKNKVIFK